MDLRTKTTKEVRQTRIGQLGFLPVRLKLAALKDTLCVCDDSEIEPFALELISIAGPTRHTFHKYNVWPLDQIASLIRSRIEADEQRAALQARGLLMRSWARLPEPCRRVALAIENANWPGIAAAALETDPLAEESVSEFIGSLDDPELLGVAVRLLCSSQRQTADRAEAFIIRHAGRLLPTRLSDRPRRLAEHHTPGPAPTHAELIRSLAQALEHMESHERSGPALAALLLLDRPGNDPASAELGPICSVVSNEHHPAFPVMRRLLRRDDSPATRRVAWRLLGDTPMAMAALERIARSGSVSQHNALLEQAHLLLNPSRAAMMAHLATSPPAKPGRTRPEQNSALPQTARGLSVQARRGLARMLTSARAHPELCESLHVESLTDRDVLTRLTNARLAPGPRLTDFCFDPSPEVARFASLRWSSVGVCNASIRMDNPAPHRARLAGKLARSPHESVRRIARDESPTVGLDTTSPGGRVRLLALLLRDRLALSEQLRAAAEKGSTDDRVEAIRTARRLRLLDGWLEFLTEIIGGGHHPDGIPARVCATAASAIGDLAIPDPGMLLDRAIARQDPRVLANTIESLDRLRCREKRAGGDGVDRRLVEFKAASEHRARANALRALSRRLDGQPDLGSTGDDLAQMLTDDRPPHRLAGVWLSERLLCGVDGRSDRWQELARRVALIAREESDAHIKARAVRCSRRLLGELSKPIRQSPRVDPALSRVQDRLSQYAAAHAGENI